MTEPVTVIALATMALAGLAITLAAALKGWAAWLEVKRLELAGAPRGERREALDYIELADLKERVRKLEAIAACVDI